MGLFWLLLFLAIGLAVNFTSLCAFAFMGMCISIKMFLIVAKEGYPKGAERFWDAEKYRRELWPQIMRIKYCFWYETPSRGLKELWQFLYTIIWWKNIVETAYEFLLLPDEIRNFYDLYGVSQSKTHNALWIFVQHRRKVGGSYIYTILTVIVASCGTLVTRKHWPYADKLEAAKAKFITLFSFLVRSQTRYCEGILSDYRAKIIKVRQKIALFGETPDDIGALTELQKIHSIIKAWLEKLRKLNDIQESLSDNYRVDGNTYEKLLSDSEDRKKRKLTSIRHQKHEQTELAPIEMRIREMNDIALKHCLTVLFYSLYAVFLIRMDKLTEKETVFSNRWHNVVRQVAKILEETKSLEECLSMLKYDLGNQLLHFFSTIPDDIKLSPSEVYIMQALVVMMKAENKKAEDEHPSNRPSSKMTIEAPSDNNWHQEFRYFLNDKPSVSIFRELLKEKMKAAAESD